MTLVELVDLASIVTLVTVVDAVGGSVVCMFALLLSNALLNLCNFALKRSLIVLFLLLFCL